MHLTVPSAAASRSSPLAAATLLLAACGGDDDDDAASAATPAATARPPRRRRPAAAERRRAGAPPRPPTTDDRRRPTTPTTGGTLHVRRRQRPAQPQPAGRRQRQRPAVRAPASCSTRSSSRTPRPARSCRGWPSRGRSTPTPPTFTFHLRDDVTFSDGTPLTADVVKANFDDIIATGAKATARSPASPATTRHGRRRPADRHRHVHDAERPVPPGGVDRRRSASSPRARWRCRSTSGPRQASSAPARSRSSPYTKDTEVVLAKRPGYAWAPDDREPTTARPTSTRSSSRSSPRPACAPAPLQSGAGRRRSAASRRRTSQTCDDDGFTLVSRANPGVVFGLSPILTKPTLDDAARAPGDRPGDRHHRGARHRAQPRVRRRHQRAVADDAVVRSTSATVDPRRRRGRRLLDEAGWTLGGDGVREKDGQRAPARARLDHQLRPQPDRAGADPGPARRGRRRGRAEERHRARVPRGPASRRRTTWSGATSAGPTATCCARSYSRRHDELRPSTTPSSRRCSRRSWRPPTRPSATQSSPRSSSARRARLRDPGVRADDGARPTTTPSTA